MIIGGIGLTAAVAGALLTPATAPGVLRRFYRITQPFGIWGHLMRELDPADRRAIRAEHRRDLLAIPFALTWHVMLFITPTLAIIGRWQAFGASLAIALAALLGLWWTWLRHVHVAAPRLED